MVFVAGSLEITALRSFSIAFETSLVLRAWKILGNNFFSEKDHAWDKSLDNLG